MKRVLEYVVLGDIQTAVAFLMSTAPDRSEEYYRAAAVTIALAATTMGPPPGGAGGGAAGGGAAGGGCGDGARATLHMQAAKVGGWGEWAPGGSRSGRAAQRALLSCCTPTPRPALSLHLAYAARSCRRTRPAWATCCWASP
jgi:hypothetical protein